MKKKGIPFGKNVSEKCRKVIEWCLQFNPERRPNTIELLNSLIENNNKTVEPEFVILNNNRKKSNSLYYNNFVSINQDNIK